MWFFLPDLLLLVIDLITHYAPSKKGKAVRKRFKLLRKKDWYQELLKKHSRLMEMKSAVRDLVWEWDIELILNREEDMKFFRLELENVLTNLEYENRDYYRPTSKVNGRD